MELSVSVGFYVAHIQSVAVISPVKCKGNLIGCHGACVCREGHVSAHCRMGGNAPKYREFNSVVALTV